jgi:hypothetical protein
MEIIKFTETNILSFIYRSFTSIAENEALVIQYRYRKIEVLRAKYSVLSIYRFSREWRKQTLTTGKR